MPMHTSGKTGITLAAAVVTAFAGLAVVGPSANATTALADCTARLNVYQYGSYGWTAQCAAPHTVSIRVERWWYWLGSPERVQHTVNTFSRQVVPGTPWSETVRPLPEVTTIQLCVSAYQDSTLPIAGPVCR